MEHLDVLKQFGVTSLEDAGELSTPNLTLIPTLPTRPDDLLTAHEVAAMLAVDISWVKNHCTRVEPFLPHIRLGGGRRTTRRFRRTDILQFIEEHFVPKLRRRA